MMEVQEKINTNRPILFSTPMVQAILDGRKTMTRRILKTPLPIGIRWWEVYDGELIFRMIDQKSVNTHCKCPYGKPGDILWVRETWNSYNENFYKLPDKEIYLYKADGTDRTCTWKPSIFMPKAACRIFLEIVKIKVERLQDISEEDSKKEGARHFIERNFPSLMKQEYPTAKQDFQKLWQTINGDIMG